MNAMKEKDGCCQGADLTWSERMGEGFPEEEIFELEPMSRSA